VYEGATTSQWGAVAVRLLLGVLNWGEVTAGARVMPKKIRHTLCATTYTMFHVQTVTSPPATHAPPPTTTATVPPTQRGNDSLVVVSGCLGETIG
jgi:hypothetical protein